jgi:hypothetical protein
MAFGQFDALTMSHCESFYDNDIYVIKSQHRPVLDSTPIWFSGTTPLPSIAIQLQV